MILSDHGFSPLKKEVNLNAFLHQTGMLHLDPNKEYYEKVAPGTVAFAMDPGRIYIHYRDKFPRGHLKREQDREVKDRLKQILFDLKDENGTSVIQSIFENEEIYKGPFFEQAPDLVCLPKTGYDLKGNLRKKEVFTTDIFRGTHTWNNAVLVAPEAVRIEDPINIEYPAKIILDYFS